MIYTHIDMKKCRMSSYTARSMEDETRNGPRNAERILNRNQETTILPSLFKFSNEKRPRTLVLWFRLGFRFAFRWLWIVLFRVSSPRNGLYIPVHRVESLLRIRCGRVTPYTCPQIIWLYVSCQWRRLHLYSDCATACVYKEKPPSNKTAHLWSWECDFENAILRMWFWECDFENAILRMWFWECGFENVILRMWFCKGVSQEHG